MAEPQVTLCTVPCGGFSQATHCVAVSAPAYAGFSRVVGGRCKRRVRVEIVPVDGQPLYFLEL